MKGISTMVQGPIGIKNAAPEAVAGSFFNFAATTAGTQVKTGDGTFLGLNVNTAGTGGANVITLYDGTSTAGAVIAIFPTTPVATFDVNPISFTTGLFVALTGTTTSGNITVVYL
jgi:hypothetical protein